MSMKSNIEKYTQFFSTAIMASFSKLEYTTLKDLFNIQIISIQYMSKFKN